MAGPEASMQIVTFQLGEDNYGIDIMEVKEIVDYDEIRVIPNVPVSVEGIYNLRGDIIPVINLHKRFDLIKAKDIKNDSLLILKTGNMQLGIIIDKVLRVITIDINEMHHPPQMLSGIGAEYIRGVVSRDEGYLLVLDLGHLFKSEELKQISQYS